MREDDSLFPHEPDHIVSLKHRGPTHEDNLAWACLVCNRFKGSDLASIDLESGLIVRLFSPRTDIWSEHFRLQNGVIVPLTAIGRVTEYLLRLNLPESVELRKSYS